MSEETTALTTTEGMGIIRDAVSDPNVDPTKLRELLAVKREWEADEARKQFAVDFAAFQAECPIIQPIDQGNKNKYAKLDRIWRETRTLRNKYGLAVTWLDCTVDSDGICHLRGLLTHRSGHCVDVAQDMPLPEAIQSRSGGLVTNAAQRMGSAMSYAKRYGECAIFGIVTGIDDDGNGGTGSQKITADQCQTLSKAISVVGGDTEKQVLAFGGVERLEDFPAEKYAKAMKSCEKL